MGNFIDGFFLWHLKIALKNSQPNVKNVETSQNIKSYFIARHHGLVVKGKDLQPRGRWFQSLHRILDCMQAKLAISLKEIKEKIAKWGTSKNTFLKYLKRCVSNILRRTNECT